MMSFDDEPAGGRARSPAAWAGALAALWLVAVAIGWWVLGERAGALLGALVALLPLGLIGLAAALARQGARARSEHERLGAEIDALRAELRSLAPGREPPEPGEGARETPRERRRNVGQTVVARPSREGARPRGEPERPLPPPPLPPAAAPEPPPPLAAADLVRALDFPEDAEDERGFEALARALADPQAAKLVQASQDVLTLLSQNGVYMDDLHAPPAPPALWRRFAGGVRGPSVGAVAGVRDEAALELASTRMARDTIFRDAAQHFLRQFDLALQRFVAHASDEEVAAFAQTRTARAFMLLSRATRSFD